MQYGAVMHRVLKDCFDAMRAGHPKSDDQLIAQFRADLAAAGIQEAYQHELYEKQGIAQLRDFVSSITPEVGQSVLHTEEPFEIRLGETTVAGRIDRIDRRADGTVAIIDYKTGKARDQQNADESLQLSLYAIAAQKKWGYPVGQLSFYNLEHNIPVTTTRSEADLLAAQDRVETAAKGIAAGLFIAKSGQHCSFCAFRSLCPLQEKFIPHRGAIAAKTA